ncbi:MAG: thioredoxin family protein [Opitutus sp.]|nr:thioredoxin family protein [Opitutus sp.]
MHPHTLRLAALGMSLALAGPALAAGDGWLEEFDAAQAVARREGRDLLIDFGGSDWCAPCKWLKERIASKPEFIATAGKYFVLVDIDDLRRATSKMPEGRKERYRALQQRYGIDTFPSVVMTTPDGLPYARTTYIPDINEPKAYWAHLEPLRQRGAVLGAALKKAATLDGAARAAALVDGLGVVPAGFVTRFYSERVAEIRRLDPADRTGYLAFLAGRAAIDGLHERGGGHGKPDTITLAELDALLAGGQLRGEALQELHVLRALKQMAGGDYAAAIGALDAMVKAHATVTRFDLGDLRPLPAKAEKEIAVRLVAARDPAAGKLGELRALNQIMEDELPDPFELSCGEGFRAGWLARPILADAFGRQLLAETASLEGEARAKAIGAALEGTSFLRIGAFSDIFDKVLRPLGKETAQKYLPARYRTWLR